MPRPRIGDPGGQPDPLGGMGAHGQRDVGVAGQVLGVDHQDAVPRRRLGPFRLACGQGRQGYAHGPQLGFGHAPYVRQCCVSDPERRIRLEAVFNFRDLGGYKTDDGRMVRWRQLFRADGLYRMTPADAETVRELGINSVLDLRTEDEIGTRGRFPVDKVPVEYHHLPFLDVVPDPDFYPTPVPPGFMAEHYHDILHGGTDHVVGALRILAQPEAYPAVFHCAAGKDRTGILAALVLSLLGVPDEDIAEDYGL